MYNKFLHFSAQKRNLLWKLLLHWCAFHCDTNVNKSFKNIPYINEKEITNIKSVSKAINCTSFFPSLKLIFWLVSTKFKKLDHCLKPTKTLSKSIESECIWYSPDLMFLQTTKPVQTWNLQLLPLFGCNSVCFLGNEAIKCSWKVLHDKKTLLLENVELVLGFNYSNLNIL